MLLLLPWAVKRLLSVNQLPGHRLCTSSDHRRGRDGTANSPRTRDGMACCPGPRKPPLARPSTTRARPTRPPSHARPQGTQDKHVGEQSAARPSAPRRPPSVPRGSSIAGNMPRAMGTSARAGRCARRGGRRGSGMGRGVGAAPQVPHVTWKIAPWRLRVPTHRPAARRVSARRLRV